MFRTFHANTADEAWQNIAHAFRQSDGIDLQDSRLGLMHEMLHVAISIEDPRQRWVMSREPAINPAFSLAEVVWIMNGMNESSFLNYFNCALPRFAGCGCEYYGAYGHRLRKHLGFDQLERAYHAFANRPESRQIVLQIWDSRLDFPESDGSPKSPDIPCNIVALLKIRNDRLEWTQIMRGNDLFRGFVYNVVQFTSLQEIMAGWLGLEIGSYNHVTDSMHVYEDSMEYIHASMASSGLRCGESLALPKADSACVFEELASLCRRIAATNISASTLAQLVTRCSLPEPYRNILCVLCAEGARRRHDVEVAQEIMGNCTNSVYVYMFGRWLARTTFKYSTASG